MIVSLHATRGFSKVFSITIIKPTDMDIIIVDGLAELKDYGIEPTKADNLNVGETMVDINRIIMRVY